MRGTVQRMAVIVKPLPVGIWRAACGLYLACMFAGTHLPLKMEQITSHNNDKVLHLLGYGGLGLLIGARLARTASTPRRKWLAWPAILLWAAFDEITQPLVGRTMDLYDWFADGTGSAIGLSVGLIVFRTQRSSDE